MFGDYSRDLLRSGIVEFKAGNREAARHYLDRALYMSNDHDVMAEAWYWISELADHPVQRREALENCLANNLDHARGRRALAILDGKLRPEEVINPDALPAPAGGLREAHARRFVCPRCGGRTTYTPDGARLVCEYCRRHDAVRQSEAKVAGHDFVVAMATERAHRRPLREQVGHCEGCGAEYILPAGRLSFACAYCGSPQVVSMQATRDLVAPDRILPHAFDQRRAQQLLGEWATHLDPAAGTRVTEPRGVYLPVWTFSLGGQIGYTGEVLVEPFDPFQNEGEKTRTVRDRVPVHMEVSIAASSKASAPFVRLIPTYDTRKMRAYDAKYLAAWAAELYDISMADASLEARSQAYARFKQDMPTLVWPAKLSSTSSANLTVESFHLDLLPVWMSEASVEGARRLVLINGRSGQVQGEGFRRSEKAGGGVAGWLADLVNG
jgi:predicted RNA-binding Zn-ribbon protein involved in translation (DUF1610 family)